MDLHRVRRIIINLVANAVKFTKKGEVEMKVSAEAEEKPTVVNVKISVRDTGPGIPLDKQPLLFTPYCQVSDSLLNPDSGTGKKTRQKTCMTWLFLFRPGTVALQGFGLLDGWLHLLHKLGDWQHFHCRVATANHQQHCSDNSAHQDNCHRLVDCSRDVIHAVSNSSAISKAPAARRSAE